MTHHQPLQPPDDERRRARFTTFATATPEDWAIISAQFPLTEAAASVNLVRQLELLGADHGGFPVSRLEHSLQTATRAERANRDDEYVLCALLHDIGDTIAPRNHPSVAAAILKPFVSEANHWMVAHHGIFQGYYFWHHLGGDRHTRDQYAESPHYDRCEEFCALFDQTSFDPDYTSYDLDHYRPLLAQFFDPQGALDPVTTDAGH